MRVSLVVVCHHSSDLMPDCVDSFRLAAQQASVEAEVVAVEQSEDDVERRAVEATKIDALVVRPNRGYAAGINAGIAEATGDTLLLANPDLHFGDGSLKPLLGALGEGYDVVGPQLVWDRAGDVLFPPAEDPAPSEELRRILRARWQSRWAAGLNAVLEDLWRVWKADGPVAVPSLRGPALALARVTADALGPLDEGYFLYYEETEWLWRARRNGARFAVVGDSVVAHHWGHSTRRRTDREQIEAQSRERFFRRNLPPLWRWILRMADGPSSSAGVSGQEINRVDEIPDTDADLWLVSSFRHLVPSVGCVGRSRLPDRFAEVTEHGRWHALAASRGGEGWRSLGSWSWGRP